MALKITPGPAGPVKGRGAPSNPGGRFEAWAREAADDGWTAATATPQPSRTVVLREAARSIIVRNNSPDVPFDRSINPYRGCEHGCVYCYARPAHAYVGLSPGIDFETRIFAKPDAAALLRSELAARGYACRPITIGGNTDPYQPAERRLGITRAIVGVLAECQHPFSIITKNALIERDLDLLAGMAAKRLVHAYVSVTSLDNTLSRTLEPRASAPSRRIEAIRRLAQAGIPVGVMVAPVIPFVTDQYAEEILERAADAGAKTAGYVMLRLPREVAPLVKEWLETHLPGKAARVMSVMQQMRGGLDYDSRWGVRQRGTGPFADLIARRFEVAMRRLGLSADRAPLDTTQFRQPQDGPQLALF